MVRVWALAVSFVLLIQTAVPEFAFAETAGPVKAKPSAPPALFNKQAPETFRCQRLFIYEGKSYGCDSNFRADGEGLRQFITPVPEAVTTLDQYQKNRILLENTAYAGTAGLVLLIAGIVGGQGLGKQLMFFGGTGILAGSLIYGLTAMRTNETVLGHAVDTYNQKQPYDKQIQLQFSTGLGL